MHYYQWQFLLVVLAGWMNRHQQDVIEYLKEENRIQRELLGGKRPRFSDDQRRRLKENNLLKSLRADQRRLKLRKGDLHSFRRYFATQMMRSGVDAETVRQWGGWKSLVLKPGLEYRTRRAPRS
jgi:integrase